MFFCGLSQRSLSVDLIETLSRRDGLAHCLDFAMLTRTRSVMGQPGMYTIGCSYVSMAVRLMPPDPAFLSSSWRRTAKRDTVHDGFQEAKNERCAVQREIAHEPSGTPG